MYEYVVLCVVVVGVVEDVYCQFCVFGVYEFGDVDDFVGVDGEGCIVDYDVVWLGGVVYGLVFDVQYFFFDLWSVFGELVGEVVVDYVMDDLVLCGFWVLYVECFDCLIVLDDCCVVGDCGDFVQFV